MKVMIPGAITLLSSNIPVTSYPEWVVGNNYMIGAIVSSSGASKGEFQALVANVGKSPEDAINVYDATKNPTGVWKFLGTQNRWRAFDQFLNTQATNTGTITMTVACYGAHALYLGNLDAIDVVISVMDNDTAEIIEGPVTIGVITEPTTHEEYGYGDWIDETQGNITYERTTLTRNISFVITINGSGTAKLGMFAAGMMRDIGATLWGEELSSIDYSTVATDTSTGATYLSKGNSAKLLNPTLISDTSQITAYYRSLDRVQGQPVVFIGETYEAFSVYGYLQKFRQTASNPSKINTSLDIVGLI
jgi:hypothetical protein